MKRKILLLVFVFFIISCQAQKADLSLQWKTFDFSEAGIKVSFPCEPSESVKTFQKEPKLAKVYNYTCKKDGFEFSVSLAEHFGKFNPEKVKDSIDDIEKGLRADIKIMQISQAKILLFKTFQGEYLMLKKQLCLRVIYIFRMNAEHIIYN